MKTINPTLNDIIDKYFNFGTCTITLINGQIITGNFTVGQIKESGKIIGWYFIPFKEQPTIGIYHDQIAIIQRTD